jgi:ribonuclease HI
MSTLIIHTDGGSRGNPGPAATGVVMLMGEKVVFEEGKFLGQQTNNEAEYQAVLEALAALPTVLKAHQIDRVEWKLDSMLVVQQLNKAWKIKEPRLAKFAQEIWKHLAQLSVPFTFSYVPRAQNAAADAILNQTLDSQA